MTVEPIPGEPWPEFLTRAYHVALTWGVVVIAGVSYSAAGVRGLMVEAGPAHPQGEARLLGQGGTIPPSPERIADVSFMTAGATGVTGPTGPREPRDPEDGDGPPGATGPTGPTGPDGA